MCQPWLDREVCLNRFWEVGGSPSAEEDAADELDEEAYGPDHSHP
jgi:hypothetical protein